MIESGSQRPRYLPGTKVRTPSGDVYEVLGSQGVYVGAFEYTLWDAAEGRTVPEQFLEANLDELAKT